jgi:MFS transporter, SP family, general alpha glucoside:H+ symporter
MAMADVKNDVNYVERQGVDYTNAGLHDKGLNEDARTATAAEHSLGLWQAIKTYKKAVFWSAMVSTSIVMEGYDTTLIGSFFAYPAFQEKYGFYSGPKNGYQLTSAWQTGLQDGGAIGNIIGALLNGYFAPKYGHRKVMLVNLAAMTAFIFIVFFAPNIQVLWVGEFLCSIPWGVFTTMGPSYAAEVCPLALRGYLAAYVNLCWAIGQLLSAAVLKGLVNNHTEWGYRIPFAVQWVWPVPLFITLFFCPESPWFLVRAGRLQEAERSLQRLSAKSHEVDHQKTVALMVHTTELEKEMEVGSSYLDCFRGTNLRRTEIACGAFLAQITDGGAFAYSPT